MMEIWRDIIGLEGYYQVSNLGRVKSLARQIKTKAGGFRSIPETIMKTFVDAVGYRQLLLRKEGVTTHFKIHRLIAIHFIPNENNYPEVNHKNGNKCDNSIENLEWCSRRDNTVHAYKMGLANGLAGSKNSQAVLTEEIVREIYESRGKVSTVDWAGKLGVSRFAIESIFRGDSWNHVTGLPKRLRDENRRVLQKGSYTYITRKYVNCRKKVSLIK